MISKAKSQFLIVVLSLLSIYSEGFSQESCIDLGTGIGMSNSEYALIDFFKNGGTWEPEDSSESQWYRVYNLDTFKIVNGSYWHWDVDWSGTINNDAWGDSWADCYISYYDMLIDQNKLDTNGYPVEFPFSIYKYKPKSEDPDQAVDSTKEVEITSISRRIYFPADPPRSGWVMKWKGTGRISFQGLENVVADAGTASTEYGESWKPDGYDFCGYDYQFESTDSGRIETDLHYMVHGWVLNILESDPNDPIRDVVFLYPGLEDDYDAGESFNPQFIERMAQFSSLRYMSYLSANSIECRTIVSGTHPYHDDDMLEWMRWEERTTKSWYEINNGSGGNYDYIIDLANATGTDPWVNIPYCAGEEYAEELVNYLMERLDTDLELYLEIGNEMWNYASGFSGYRWQAAKRVFEYPGLGDVEGRGAHINMVFEKVTEVAGERNLPRITRVYAGFPRYADINNRTLGEIDSDNWDAFATTWYFNLSEDNSDDNDCLDPESGANWASVLYNWHLENPDDQQGFNERYRDYLLTEFRCDGGYTDNSDVVLSNYYEKDIICYEGGNHTLHGCENAPTGGELDDELDFDTPTYPDYITDNSYINAICVADESEEMAEVYAEIIDSMQTAGIGLANHLSFAGRSSCYGVWSFIQPRDITESLEYLLENYPKFNLFSETIAESNCDAVEVILDTNTVGPGLSILLDGVDDYVIGQTSYVPDESSDYTLETWFNALYVDVDQVLASFSNDGSNNNYNILKLRSDGKLIWEIGNNTSYDAKLIGTEIEPDNWYHVALTKESERYSLYINGYKVASANYTLSAVTRSNYTIGALANSSTISNVFAGYIDEVRLWDAARSESEIRDYMCKKITSSVPAFTNLRSYYMFDHPDYTSALVYDHATETLTASIQNLSFTDRSRYAISGAAIGDMSTYRYESTWDDISLSITHPDGDMLAVSNIGDGSPNGIQLYIIDDESYYNDIPEYYDGISNERTYGVFMANGSSPDYDLTYAYNGNPDAETGNSEANNRLLRRDMYSSEEWSHAGAEINLTANALSVSCQENTRGEYNIAIRNEETTVWPGPGYALQNTQAPTEENYGLLRYLNLDDYTVTFWAKGWGNVYNFTDMLGSGEHRFNINDNGEAVYCGMRNRADWLNGTQDIGNSVTYASTDEWVHYSITRSGTSITIYINGEVFFEEDLLYPFTFSEMYLFHDPSWQSGNYEGGVCNLTIDELSVWNIALDQSTLQNWMCKKITDEHPNECENLLLYFNFDQGTGTVLEDKRGSSDITLTSVAEGFNYITSGAAIGDVSIADYSSPENLSFSHEDGDYLEINRISGTSNGAHIYRTDNTPPVQMDIDHTDILSVDSTRYWGIYIVKAYGTNPQYTVSNYYENNSQINLSYESELRLLNRFDNADSPWTANIDTLPNISDHSLNLADQLRGEYILGGTSENTFNEYTAPEQPVFYPEDIDLNLDTICGNSTALVYAVENDPDVETYIWTLPEGLDAYSITDTIIINASYSETETDTLTLSVVAVNRYGESPAAYYEIIVLPAPSISDAGPDQILIPPLNSTEMDGNTPATWETGQWSLGDGIASIGEPNNPVSSVSSIGNGFNSFAWSISNGECEASIDSMLITVAPAPLDVVLLNGEPLPSIFCEGETVSVRVIPEEDIENDGYTWILPDGLSLLSQTNDTAIFEVSSGSGGYIEVAALYGSSTSEYYQTDVVNINALPNSPIFTEYSDILCLNVDAEVTIAFDASIDSVEWFLPEGIYPVDWPKSTSESITIQALSIISGYISAQTFNDGCTSEFAIDSFEVSVNEAPDKPVLYLGTDDGVADQFCGNEYALLWVEDPDDNVTYEWTNDVNTSLIQYFGENNYGALYLMPDENNEILVRAVEGEGSCSTSEWFTFNGWTQDVSPSEISAVTIIDPTGQDQLSLEIGETYTILVEGSGDHYYWDVPEGFSLIEDDDLYDNTLQISVNEEAAGILDVYSITLKGCASQNTEFSIATSASIFPPEYVSGELTICQGSNLSITVTDVGASSYTWTLPDSSVYVTSINELDVLISSSMKGYLTVVASDGIYTSSPTKIAIEVQAINLSAMGFIDEDGNNLNELEVCSGDDDRPIYHKDALASSYIWEIHGSAIQFEPRYESGFEGDSDYELYNRTSPVDTMMPISWVDWRTNYDDSDVGFIVVTAVNGCGGAHVSDSIYYYWEEPLSLIVPEFIEAPTELCVGSQVNYEIENIDGASEYIWSLPNGLEADEIITTIPNITADVVYGTGGSLSVFASGDACGGSNTFSQVIEPISISGEEIDFYFVEEPLTACSGDSITYTVNDIGVSTYNWTVPGGIAYTTIDNSDTSGVNISSGWSQGERDNMINGEYIYADNNYTDRSIIYTPELSYTGTYRVHVSGFVRYNSVRDMPIVVTYKDGVDTLYINTKLDPEDDIWQLIGDYEFDAGTTGSVEITTHGEGGGISIADAARFEILSISGDSTQSFAVSGTEGGAVCVSVDVPQCESDYMICSESIDLGSTLQSPDFVLVQNSVCEGDEFEFIVTDIGADSYTWHLPTGMSIEGETGIVSGKDRSVLISMDTDTEVAVQIAVNGVLASCAVSSDTIYSGNILFDGIGCNGCDTFNVTVSDFKIIDPESCTATGSVIFYLQEAEDLQVFDIDYNFDDEIDASGVVNGDSLVITNIEQGTLFSAVVLIESLYSCEVYSSDTGRIVTYNPATIDSSLILQPEECGLGGALQLALSDVINGEEYYVDYTNDGVYDDSSSVTNDTLLFSDIDIGTDIYDIEIVNKVNQCSSFQSFSGTIEAPADINIITIVTIDPSQCDGSGEMQITISGAAELDLFAIDYTNDDVADTTVTLLNDSLTVTGLDIGSQINNITLTHLNTNCSATSTESFLINQPDPEEVILSEIDPLCADGDSIQLNHASPSGGIYSIDDLEITAINPQLYSEGSYSLVYSYLDSNQCLAGDTTLFVVNTIPETGIYGETFLCPGASDEEYSSTLNANYTYTWLVNGGNSVNGENSDLIVVEWNLVDSGSVSLSIQDTITTCFADTLLLVLFSDTLAPDIEECTENYTVEAIFDDTWHYIFTAEDSEIIPEAYDYCSGDNLTWQFTSSNSDTNALADFEGYRLEMLDEQSITWIVYDDFGNSASCVTSIEFVVDNKPPTAFSPNGDGINDYWQIDFLLNYPECVVKIFNRWSNLVYESETGYPIPWNGSHKGNILPVDTYYYIIDLGSGASTIKGYVNLIY